MSGFAPIIGDTPHTLILGSMPGQVSLSEMQYYANPNNSFWWILGHLYGFSDGLSYSMKTSKLTNAGVAVWDVLYDCNRKGSLDRDIERNSEQINDFSGFFEKNSSIRLIAFNGGAARQIFMRHCKQLLVTQPNLAWIQLPSTSPAHASIDKYQKLQLWRSELIREHTNG